MCSKKVYDPEKLPLETMIFFVSKSSL